MQLTAKNVEETFIKCLFDEGEQTTNAIIVDGVTLKAGFKPENVKQQHDAIIALLAQLPTTFMQNSGGGWSFLNAVYNNDSEQWAISHESADQLLCMGLAIGKAAFNMPRPLWGLFPYQMPYFYVKQ